MPTTYESAQRHLGRHTPDDWVETAGRVGYATKGVVYAIIGVLAAQAAFTAGTTSGADAKGALREIGSQPFGQILLALTAIGLVGYTVWRFIQAFYDAEGDGSDAKGIAKRAWYVISGAIYGFLAWTAASLAFGWGGGGGQSKQGYAADLMSQTWGRWLIGFIGVAIIGIALGHAYQVYTAKFMKKYEGMDAQKRLWARRVGRAGLSARGVTFAIIGWFMLQSAITYDPNKTKGLSGALATISQQAYGPWLLALVAVGLFAYGVHCFARAKYRRFQTARV